MYFTSREIPKGLNLNSPGCNPRVYIYKYETTTTWLNLCQNYRFCQIRIPACFINLTPKYMKFNSFGVVTYDEPIPQISFGAIHIKVFQTFMSNGELIQLKSENYK